MCNKRKRRSISRRKFLGEASCAALGSTTFLSSVLNLGMINTAAARPHIIGSSGDYKAMVCILLAGGADTYNFLVPTDTTHYDFYSDTRSTLALAPSEILGLNYNNGGKTYGVHQAMPNVQSMFNSGDLSFISNIGTLIEPVIDANDYYNGNKQLPLGLYSHSDQIMQWQTSVPQSRSAVGVGGRIADMIHSMNTIPEISMNISLSGKNRFQAGNTIAEYSIDNATTDQNIGFERFPSWWSNSGFLNATRDSAINSMVNQSYANIFQETFGNIGTSTMESNEILKVALANVTPLPTTFSTTGLSQDLKKIAEIMSVRSHLGVSRQIFFITFGGWDHHDNVLGNLNAMLPVVDNALSEFNQAMIDLGLHDDVVTFTISDFARTLTSNGNGSDHAWGGNQIVMGGPVNGTQIFGDYPSMDLTNPLNLSDRGRFVPQISVDEFYAEVALWFGVSPNDLDYILPNLCNFYSPGCPAGPPANYMPIGIL